MERLVLNLFTILNLLLVFLNAAELKSELSDSVEAFESTESTELEPNNHNPDIQSGDELEGYLNFDWEFVEVPFENHVEDKTDDSGSVIKLPSIFDFVKSSTSIQTHDAIYNYRSKERRPSDELLKALRRDLKEKFITQHPFEKYSLRHYYVENWPEGVDIFKSKWNKKEMAAIREKMENFVFVNRQNPISSKIELFTNNLGNVYDVLDHSMTYQSTYDFLLKRYYDESGDRDSCRIKWYLLDRRDIPRKYDEIDINGCAMIMPLYYRNPEIVYNIHFHSLYAPAKRAKERERERERESNCISYERPTKRPKTDDE